MVKDRAPLWATEPPQATTRDALPGAEGDGGASVSHHVPSLTVASSNTKAAERHHVPSMTVASSKTKVASRSPLRPTQPAQATTRNSLPGMDGHGGASASHHVPSASPKNQVVDLTSSSPVFGQASPLRNPLVTKTDDAKSHNHIFNIPRGGPRIEHHSKRPTHTSATAPHVPAISQRFVTPGATSQPATSTVPGIPGTQQTFRRPGDATSAAPQSRTAQAQSYVQFANQRPTFSSQGPGGGYQAVIPHAAPRPQASTNRADNDSDDDDDDDDFDPNAGLRDVAFGEADPHAYLDVENANKHMKALLEGAFDEEAPKLKLRKRSKPVKEAGGGGKGLAGKLAALEVADKEAERELTGDDEADDGSIDGLTCKLLPHQVEGLAWMTDKEIGERKKGSPLPKGGILADDMGLGKTIQSVALILTNPRPTDAEIEEANKKIRLKRQRMSTETGKGTLVVAPLALIRQWEAEIKTKVSKSHALKVLVHHGPSRTKLGAELKKYDVVITTYQIVASEHSSGADGPKLGCFGLRWYRIILDEAHTVKNRLAKSTKACYALSAHFRWCLTGTPMQNNLDELQSLIAFLRIKPYCETGPWKEQISIPMKNGRGGLAMKRLQFFLKACMKRRTKDVLRQAGALNPGGKPTTADGEGQKQASNGFKIVERKVENIVAEFNERERAFYDNLSARAQHSLEDMMAEHKMNHIGALVLLLRLRQACNHPKLITAGAKKDGDAFQGAAPRTPGRNRAGDDEADDLADLLGGLSVESKKCDGCGSKLSSPDVQRGYARCGACEHDKDVFDDALEVVDQLVTKTKKGGKSRKGKDKDKKENRSAMPAPRRRNRAVVTDSDDDEGEWIVPDGQRNDGDLGVAGGTDDEDAEGGGETLNSATDDGDEDDSSSSSDDDDDDSSARGQEDPKQRFRRKYINNASGSTKIRHLLRILDAETAQHKVIVFSQFTSMLDLVEPFLGNSGFVFTRYDGSMRNDDRERSLARLRTDAATRVLLCSLKCGSLGLNLTAASRVVLLEPFWNPFVEEQAIDRVHRLNQTVDVRVFKITIKDSVEERILELQESKRKLANAAIEQGGAKGLNKLSMKDIMNLFRRDAEIVGDHQDKPEDEALGRFGKVLPEPVRPGAERGDTGRVPERSKAPLRKPAQGAGARAEDPVFGRR